MLDESEMMIPAQADEGPSVFHPLLRILLLLMSAWSPSTSSPETSHTMALRPLCTSLESLITKAT